MHLTENMSSGTNSPANVKVHNFLIEKIHQPAWCSHDNVDTPLLKEHCYLTIIIWHKLVADVAQFLRNDRRHYQNC